MITDSLYVYVISRACVCLNARSLTSDNDYSVNWRHNGYTKYPQ